MDDFKLKSLDDFDSMFMSSNKSTVQKPAVPAAPAAPVQQPAAPVQQPIAPVAPAQSPAAPAYRAPVAPAAPVQQPAAPVKQPAAAKKENLIPEMETGPVEISFFEIDGVPVGSAPAAQKPESNVYRAAPVQQPVPAQNQNLGNAPQSAQAPVSLYRAEGMQDNGVKQFLYEPDRTDDIDDYKPEKKSDVKDVLPLVGKIASIVMLAVTLIIFVIGCFITLFLNNKDQKCGSVCFATLTEDATGISGGSDNAIKKGSLVICKSLDISEYQAGDIVALPVSNAEGCKLYQVTDVDTASKLLTVTETSENRTSQSVKDEDIYGLATYNFGGLGKVIQFASNNAILVCILFLLLAALWCLFIILIERSQEKKAPKEEDDDDSDNGGLSF